MNEPNKPGEAVQLQESATSNYADQVAQFVQGLRDSGQNEMANLFNRNHQQMSPHNFRNTLDKQTKLENTKSASLNPDQQKQLQQMQQTRLANTQSSYDRYRGYSPATAANMKVIKRSDDPERPIGKMERKFNQSAAELQQKMAPITNILQKASDGITNIQGKRKAAAEKKAEAKKENTDEATIEAGMAAARQSAVLKAEDAIEEEREEREEAFSETEEPEEGLPTEPEKGDELSGENPDHQDEENIASTFSDKESIQTEHGTVRKKGDTLTSKSPKALMSVVAARGSEKFIVSQGSAEGAIECMKEGLNQGVPVVALSPAMEKKVMANPATKEQYEKVYKPINDAKEACLIEKKVKDLDSGSATLQAEAMAKLSDPSDKKHYNPTAAAALNKQPIVTHEDRRDSIDILQEKYENGDITKEQFTEAATPMMNSISDEKKAEFRAKDGGNNSFTKAETTMNEVKNQQQNNPQANAENTATMTASTEPRPTPSTPPEASANTDTANATENQTRARSTADTSAPQQPNQSWTRESNADVLTAENKGEALSEKASKNQLSDNQMHNLKEVNPEEYPKTVTTALSTPQPEPKNEEEAEVQQQRQAQKSANTGPMMSQLNDTQIADVADNLEKSGKKDIQNDGNADEQQRSLKNMETNLQQEQQQGMSKRPVDKQSTRSATPTPSPQRQSNKENEKNAENQATSEKSSKSSSTNTKSAGQWASQFGAPSIVVKGINMATQGSKNTSSSKSQDQKENSRSENRNSEGASNKGGDAKKSSGSSKASNALQELQNLGAKNIPPGLQKVINAIQGLNNARKDSQSEKTQQNQQGQQNTAPKPGGGGGRS